MTNTTTNKTMMEKAFKEFLSTKHMSVKRFRSLKPETQDRYIDEFKAYVEEYKAQKAEQDSKAEEQSEEAGAEVTEQSEAPAEEATETPEQSDSNEETPEAPEAPTEPETPEAPTEPKQKKSKAEPIITLKGLDAFITGCFNDKYDWSTHTDPNKKKVMVRWKGSKMLFKVFIQKTQVKVHLKTKEAWEAYNKTAPTKVEPFFQNGFNLPYAVKMSLSDFNTHFTKWAFTEYVDTLGTPAQKTEKQEEANKEA